MDAAMESLANGNVGDEFDLNEVHDLLDEL
jgi:hypothetical protein